MGLNRFSSLAMIYAMVLLESWWSCHGCLEEERSALLRIKSSFNYPSGKSLKSWGKVADCCTWERVECNFSTGRTVSLYLSFTRSEGLGDFYLNVSLFQPFKELELLYLSGNFIVGWVKNEGFERLSKLDSLKFLDLGNNKVDNSFLSSLGGLSSLTTLYLNDNQLKGAISIDALTSLKNLEELHLSYSTLDNSFLQVVGKITTLKTLYLKGCRLKGYIPSARGLCQLKLLIDLSIRENDLNGVLPWCLANLTSLQNLDLSSNHFTGDISLSPLTSLKHIQTLILSDNQFKIPVSLRPFFNHSNLKYFQGSNNEIYVEESEEHNLIPKFQLWSLFLSGQVYGGAFSFPKFLFYQYNMQEIYFSNMKMRGGVPNWLLENNTNLYELSLLNNSFSGPLQLPIHPHVSLFFLDISDNYFDGHIPTEIGAYFPSLVSLSMANNHFNGSIPSSFSNMSSLHVLDLSENIISGTLPSCFSSLPLYHVYLSQNELQGSLEDAFDNSFKLVTLDLSHNRLTGNIPEWIGDVSYMSFLLLGYNNLEGRLPIQLCKVDKLSFIDLSHNEFSGPILPCLKFRSNTWSFTNTLLPSDYMLQKPLEITTKSVPRSYAPSTLYYMTGIDLSCNNLSGEIPPEIGNFDHIQLLNLSNNHLIGPIPQTFSNLSAVESLDLSHNNLNGEIPLQLTKLHFLSDFSVAHNNLSGKTPEMVTQFSTFNKSSYEGNPLLCGPPLPTSYTKEEAPPPPPKSSIDDKEESSIIDAEVFYVSFVVTYIMVLSGIAAVLYINPCWRQAWFYFIERSINICYYFVADNLLKPFRIRVWKPLV